MILSVIVFAALPAGAASVSAVVHNISDNAVQAGGAGFDLAFSSDAFKLSKQYIKLDYTPYTNAPAWRLDMYTNNTNASPGLLQKGGLIGVSTNAAHVPLAWNKSSAVSTPSVVDISTGSAGGWTWLKDKGDVDDPSTSGMNESWLTAYYGGYTTLASGGLSNSNPATVYLYFEGDFNAAPADNYNCNIWFDMYQVLDDSAPTIIHTPISNIISLGDNLTFKATVIDDSFVGNCALYYKVGDGVWENHDMVATGGTQTNKSFQYTPTDIGNAAKVSYFIVATDGYNFAVFDGSGLSGQPSLDTAVAHGKATPQVITISDNITFSGITSGSFIVPDGNPNDGNTSITIPTGALSSAIDLKITQLDPDDTAIYPSRDSSYELGKKPVAIYDFLPEGQHFNMPIDMTLLFLADTDPNDVVRMPDGTVLTGVKKRDLKVYWWDGFVWRAMGGKLDDNLNTLTIKTDHFSKYAIFYQPAMSADEYRPKEKIITPNGDDKNPYASFDGLVGEDYTISIFDIRGHKVKTITTSSLPRWDGTDDGGRVVESGVYLYQFKADVNGSSKLISGTIVVAK